MLGRGIQCFLVTTETLSFSETARRLGVSQQAVSQSILRLEQKLGLPLFSRSRRTLQLTQFGTDCRTLFQETSNYLEKRLDDLRAQALQTPRKLFVGYQNYLDLTELMASSIQQIKEKNSTLTVVCERYSPAGLIDGLFSGKLDVILLCQRFLPEKAPLQRVFLTRLPLLLLFSSSFSLTGHDWPSLRKAPFIIDRLEGENDLDLEMRAWKEADRAGMEPERIMAAPNRDSAYIAAEMGQGVLLCTSISKFASVHGMKTCNIDASDDLVCCWHAHRSDPFAKEFAEILKNRAGG